MIEISIHVVNRKASEPRTLGPNNWASSVLSRPVLEQVNNSVMNKSLLEPGHIVAGCTLVAFLRTEPKSSNKRMVPRLVLRKPEKVNTSV